MPESNPRVAERTDLLRRLRRLRDHVISQAGLAAEPNEAYEPLPPGLSTHPARALNDVQHRCQYLIEIVLLATFRGAGAAELNPIRRDEILVPAAQPFAEVAEEFRLQTNRMLDLLDDIDLDASSAGEMWVRSEVYGMQEEFRRVPARSVLLDLIEELSRAAGEFRTYWMLAQDGHLIDVED